MNWEEEKKAWLAYRREYCIIEVDNDPKCTSFPDAGEVALRIVQFGRRFSVVSLLPEEIDRVMELLAPHAKTKWVRAKESEET